MVPIDAEHDEMLRLLNALCIRCVWAADYQIMSVALLLQLPFLAVSSGNGMLKVIEHPQGPYSRTSYDIS